ncbi:7749_t:CDS:2 [Gigaspora margarita]|uniref:7749_t:CDS:1 n=1 Tax=Gigaspora margarita TaxID=4874 RepID=A0ABN7UNI1_GIGMA|nr:7749_t:CDS:2 [Gigaspora margarita]
MTVLIVEKDTKIKSLDYVDKVKSWLNEKPEISYWLDKKHEIND